MPEEKSPASVPDPAVNYERARPEDQSPQGELKLDKPAGKNRADQYNEQNSAPNEKKH
jgi:hypothetical protein